MTRYPDSPSCLQWPISASPEAERLYCNAFKCATTGGYEYHISMGERRRRQAREMNHVLIHLIGHSSFPTAAGRFRIAVPGCNSGDNVCALQGGPHVYSLRRIGSDSALVKIYGAAFMPHLEKQHQRDSRTATRGRDIRHSIESNLKRRITNAGGTKCLMRGGFLFIHTSIAIYHACQVRRRRSLKTHKHQKGFRWEPGRTQNSLSCQVLQIEALKPYGHSYRNVVTQMRDLEVSPNPTPAPPSEPD